MPIRSRGDLDRVGKAWVATHRQLAELAVGAFLGTGSWPDVKSLQRRLDRSGDQPPEDVIRALQDMPTLGGQRPALEPARVELPLWLLRLIPSAGPLVQMCLAVAKRTVALYEAGDEGDILLSNDDPVLQRAENWPGLLQRAATVVYDSRPSPFSGGNRNEEDGTWSYVVDDAFVRRLRSTGSIDDYVEQQFNMLRHSRDSIGPIKIRTNGDAPHEGNSANHERGREHLSGMYAIAAAVIGAATLVFLTVHFVHNDGSNDSSSRSAATSTPSSSSMVKRPATAPGHIGAIQGITVASHRLKLDRANFCSWRLGTNPVPVLSTRPVRLVLDDRCNFPQDPNPATDGPTSVYSAATKSSTRVGEVHDGQVVTLRCYQTGGDEVPDAVNNKSTVWLGLVAPVGLIPNVNVGGGYTVRQLQALKLPTC